MLSKISISLVWSDTLEKIDGLIVVFDQHDERIDTVVSFLKILCNLMLSASSCLILCSQETLCLKDRWEFPTSKRRSQRPNICADATKTLIITLLPGALIQVTSTARLGTSTQVDNPMSELYMYLTWSSPKFPICYCCCCCCIFGCSLILVWSPVIFSLIWQYEPLIAQ